MAAMLLVMSLYGLFTPQTLHYDPELIGLWRDGTTAIQFLPGPEKATYEVHFLDPSQPLRRFVGRCVKLQDQLILDLMPVPEHPDPYSLPTHIFYRIRRTDAMIQLDMLNGNTLMQLAGKSGAASPDVVRVENKCVLISPTRKLQTFFERRADEADLWMATPTLQRQDPAAALEVGMVAPEFRVKDQKGNAVRLSQFRGRQNVVLIFYPGDDTPGCTKQLCAVRDDYSQFVGADVAFFGVNPQDAGSHQQFIDKFTFPFPLLVDNDKQLMGLYGCTGKRSATRTVYGIDKNGIIIFAQRGMPANADILAAFKLKL